MNVNRGAGAESRRVELKKIQEEQLQLQAQSKKGFFSFRNVTKVAIPAALTLASGGLLWGVAGVAAEAAFGMAAAYGLLSYGDQVIKAKAERAEAELALSERKVAVLEKPDNYMDVEQSERTTAEQLEVMKTALETELELLRTQTTKLEKQLTEANEKYRSAEAQVKLQKGHLGVLERDKKEKEDSIKRLAEQLSKAEGQLKSLETAKDKAEKRLEDVRFKLETSSEKLRKINTGARDKVKQVNAKDERDRSSQQDLIDLKQQLDKVQKEKFDLKEELIILKQDFSEIKQEALNLAESLQLPENETLGGDSGSSGFSDDPDIDIDTYLYTDFYAEDNLGIYLKQDPDDSPEDGFKLKRKVMILDEENHELKMIHDDTMLKMVELEEDVSSKSLIIQDLEDELVRVKNEVNKLVENTNEMVSEQSEEYEKKISEYKDQVGKIQKELQYANSIESKNEIKLQKEVDTLKESKAVLEDDFFREQALHLNKNNDLELEVQRKQEENERLSETNRLLISDLEKVTEKYNGKIKDKSAEILKLQEEIEIQRVGHKEELEGELQKQKSRFNAEILNKEKVYKSSLNAIDRDNGEAQDQYIYAQKEVDSLKKELEKSSEENKDLEDRLKKAEEQNSIFIDAFKGMLAREEKFSDELKKRVRDDVSDEVLEKMLKDFLQGQ
ncbi:hypothetical protein ACH42_15700 [Endozoicomonas sp. (ex Bugula neritina AB1)]|nr:hypothetical protein ACH42_15700 [Endozoicomonas sp. (ex Bugula neritina AB1)]